MFRYAMAAGFALLICTIALAGELKCTITKVEYTDKDAPEKGGTLTVKDDSDKEVIFKFDKDTKFSTKKKGADTDVANTDLGKNKMLNSGTAKATVTFDGDKPSDKPVQKVNFAKK